MVSGECAAPLNASLVLHRFDVPAHVSRVSIYLFVTFAVCPFRPAVCC